MAITVRWHRRERVAEQARGVESDAFGLVRRPRFSLDPVIGAVAACAVDSWRVRAALEIAARGGGPLEAFDAVA